MIVAHPPHLTPPLVVTPGPQQASFGLIAGRVGRRAERVVVRIDGRVRATQEPRAGRFSFYLKLPPRDVSVRVTAVDKYGRGASTVVRPVLGLPSKAAPRFTWGRRDPRLSRLVTRLARRFPGTSAAFVENLRTGAGAAWNARARFPAASTLKLAIAVQVLRLLGGRPPAAGTRVAELMDAMLIHSDNVAANELVAYAGGGSAVNGMLRTVGLTDTEMFGGYLPGTASGGGREIPIQTISQPAFGIGKYTTAWDLGRLIRYVDLAAGGKGPLAKRFSSFSSVDGRYLLYELGHVREPGRLGRFMPYGIRVAHKAGWISTARHDNGIVFWPGGSFVVTVMTWMPGGAGTSSDVLAGRIAQASLALFRRDDRMR